MTSFNHTRCPQVGPGASSLAPAGGKFEGALGVPKAGQGARLGLSGTTYVNDVFSLKVSCFRLMLTPKAISLVVHPPFSNPRFLWTPRVRGTRSQFEGCPTKGKTRSQQLLSPVRAPGQARPQICTHPRACGTCLLHAILPWLPGDLL